MQVTPRLWTDDAQVHLNIDLVLNTNKTDTKAHESLQNMVLYVSRVGMEFWYNLYNFPVSKKLTDELYQEDTRLEKGALEHILWLLLLRFCSYPEVFSLK